MTKLLRRRGFGLENLRFSRTSVIKALCLILLATFARIQALPPCATGTQFRTVRDTDSATNLSKSLQCSNGAFNVKWVGDVIVTETIHVTENTTLDITGAAPGAIANGDNSAQLFFVDGASSLHLMDMILAKGVGFLGGAVQAEQQSRVSWSGNTSFTGNTADTGGAIYADSSTISWDGIQTVFSNNTANYVGGAPLVINYANVACNGGTIFLENAAQDGAAVAIRVFSHGVWDGQTVFTNNKAEYWGGALYVNDHSSISFKGTTTCLENSAQSGAGVVIYGFSSGSWDGETVFTKNQATYWGGAIFIDYHSSTSCKGNTTFFENIAQDGAGMMVYDLSSGVWSGTTAFIGNTASGSGGGLNVHTSSDASWAGTMTFAKNTAGRGGAMLVRDSDVSWTGTTTFADNIAYHNGGALYAILDYRLIWNGARLTTFRNNRAINGDGGALSLYGSQSAGSSNVRCSNETIFADNSAFGNRGAIVSSGGAVGLYFEEATFQFNSARVGGAIAIVGTGNGDEVNPLPSNFVRCNFSNNMAVETGGAVESAYGQEEFENSNFEGNFADVGGALRLGGTTVILGCSFIFNSALTLGSAIATIGSVDISNTEFEGNFFYCPAGEYLGYSDQEGPNGTRYEAICDGCLSWERCSNCTIEDAFDVPKCSVALEHTTAEQPGTVLGTLVVSEGYWRVSNVSTNVLECYNTAACRGGITGTANFCGDGYTGPYCAVCQTKYSPSIGASCTWCSTSELQGLVVCAILIVIVAICTMAAFSAYLVSTVNEERELGFLHRKICRMIPLQAIKTVVVVWQILTQFASVANVSYPGLYQVFLSAVDVINLDLGFIGSVRCLWPGIDFHDRLLVVTIGPLVIVGSLALTYTIALRRNSVTRAVEVSKIRNKHLSALLLLSYLVYSSVSSTVFQTFACDVLDNDAEYLRADYRLRCTDNKHQALQVYAGIMIAVYPLGIPLLYAIGLCRYRDILVDSRADTTRAQPIADLAAPYRPERYYYEVIECGRRLMLTSVVVFIYPNDAAQVAITFLIAFVFFTVSEILSPFESRSDMWLSRGGHIILLLSVFDLLLLKVDASDESSESQQVFARVLVAGHVLMVLAAVVEAIGICYASSRQVIEQAAPSRKRLGSGHGNDLVK